MPAFSLPGRWTIARGLSLIALNLALVTAPLWLFLPPEPRATIAGAEDVPGTPSMRWVLVPTLASLAGMCLGWCVRSLLRRHYETVAVSPRPTQGQLALRLAWQRILNARGMSRALDG